MSMIIARSYVHGNNRLFLWILVLPNPVVRRASRGVHFSIFTINIIDVHKLFLSGDDLNEFIKCFNYIIIKMLTDMIRGTPLDLFYR